VASTADTLRALAPALAPEALLLDVGSTKGDVVTAARAVLGSRLRQFVPAHPIAGKEKAGVEHASADLYRGCQVILTPLAETGPEHTAVARRLWQALGARVRTMTAADHDAAYAAVSHLPHLLAFAAVQALARQPQGAEFLTLAGPGFRDFTRIAASDPDVWRDILLANAGQVRQQAQHFRAALDRFEATLASGDAEALRALIAEASAVRSRWGLPPGTAEQADPPTRHVPHPLP
jgi:prephenate dehydrogenase